MIDIYNNTGDKLTIGYIELEKGHNWVDKAMWAQFAEYPATKELIANCRILVANYEDYRIFSDKVESLFSELTGDWDSQYPNKDADDIKRAIEKVDSIEADEIEIEFLSEDFGADQKLAKKLNIIAERLPEYKTFLESIISGAENGNS